MQPIIVAVVVLLSSPALAENYSKVRATGLAHLLEHATKCGYRVSTVKLSAYFKSEGLDNPEALAWLNHKRAIEAGWANEATEQTCALARATAESIDIVE